MTALQLDATVVSAEAHLLQSLLYLMDESKIGFVKCAMTVRSGWKLYERCDEALGNAVTSIRGSDGSFGMRGPMATPLTGKVVDEDADAMISDDDDDDGDGSVEDSVVAGLGVTAEDATAAEKEMDLPASAPAAAPDTATGAAAAAGSGAGTGAGSAAASVGAGVSSASDVPASLLGGVLFGIGGFNILLSVLPPLILRIVEALGFPHNRCVNDRMAMLQLFGLSVKSRCATAASACLWVQQGGHGAAAAVRRGPGRPQLSGGARDARLPHRAAVGGHVCTHP
jgi:hypothetical protein